MKAKAEDYVVQKCGDSFKEILMAPPYTKEGRVAWVIGFIVHDNENKSFRGTKGVTAIAVSETGEIKDQWTFSYIMLPKGAKEKFPKELLDEEDGLKNMISRN